MEDGGEDPALASAFTVESQRLELDFSFCPRLVKGKTTITIQPQSPKLRWIRLNCRQLRLTAVRLRGRDAPAEYHDLYQHLSLFPSANIHQYHFVRERLGRHELGDEDELVIPLPAGLRVHERRQAETQEVVCEALVVEIEYTLDQFRDGLHFVGVEDGDSRYPHAYTRNAITPGFASSLFPCVDDGSTRYPFELSVRYPRTVAEALCKSGPRDDGPRNSGARKADSVMSGPDDDHELSEEERALEMRAVCSGELTDTIVDPNDPSRTTSSFKIETKLKEGVLPQHVGIAIGPFQEVDLSQYRDEAENDRLQDQAVRVHAFCLPGKEDELKNSAVMIPATLDSFVDCYQTYRLGKSYQLVFVDDLDCDTAHTMALTICSSRLLYPDTVWEPQEHTTRVLVHAVASQWIGVDVIAQEASDHWIIVGASWFMTEFYLRELFGRNDHRFRQKLAADRIVEMDIRRPSLYDLGRYLYLDPGEQEFMNLKALAVLSILHNRLVKASGKNGVDRCLYRLLLNRASGGLNNGAISTDAFMVLCERVGHQKLDTFFKQWVYGSGCPTFECHPTFNKKKQVVQLTIRQTQATRQTQASTSSSSSTATFSMDSKSSDPIDTQPASNFMREAKERIRGFLPDSEWPAFVGPMTIRIHEADGTPYEHIVDINSSNVRVEIPYNTKYKRIKRNKLNKERMTAAQGVDAGGEMQDEVTIYSLGDLYLNPEEASAWKIEDWAPEIEQKMENEAYEWIRVDADFEWISRISINDMPSYMFISQLQQDKDVVAQAESIQYLARKRGHEIISSFLVKTLMDGRYFHGIRTLAAQVLAKQSCPSGDGEAALIGLFHLKKSFHTLFCDPTTLMTRPNDFGDRAMYLVQCAIVEAIAKVKTEPKELPDSKTVTPKTPLEVKQFLLDVIRHNDNRGNDFRDDRYLATLMRGLTDCLIGSKSAARADDAEVDLMAEAEEYEFRKKAMSEIDRHKRLDEWLPTYNNVSTMTALECDVRLMINGMKPVKVSEFLLYTQTGNAENVRLKAWDCLIRLGAFKNKDSVTRYMIYELHADPSPYFRAQLRRILGTAIGQIALKEEFVLDPSTFDGGLQIEGDQVQSVAREQLERQLLLDAALRGLKTDLAHNENLKQSLETALKAKTLSLSDVSELLDLCELFVDPVNELKVTLKYPRYWRVERLGPELTADEEKPHLIMRFVRGERVRTRMIHPHPNVYTTPSVEPPRTKPKIVLKTKKLDDPQSRQPTPGPAPTSAPADSLEPAQDPSAQRTLSFAAGVHISPVMNLESPASASPQVKANVPSPLSQPAQTPAPTPVLTVEPSAPMEGVELTSAPPAEPSPPPVPLPPPPPAPISTLVPVPAAIPTPTPAEAAKPPKLKIKTKASKPPKPPAAPKSKKSKIVKLQIAPKKLADRLSTLGKRKAELDVDPRPTKRQSTEPPLANGGAGRKSGLVAVEKTKGEKPRLLVKMRVGRGKLPIL